MRIYQILTLILIITSGCFIERELPVEYDYSYRGKFNNYKTFDFANLSIDSNDPIRNNLIQNSIRRHMNWLGYKHKINNPDLILFYYVYLDSLNLRGYNQIDIKEFVALQNKNLHYNKEKYKIDGGTLLIQIYDRKQNSAIWQGYATNNYVRIDYHDYREVKNAVRSILNNYQFFAEDFFKDQKATLDH